MNIAPSALTRRMQELEREIGVPLFIREGRRISLTASGEAVLREARRILNQVNETCELARAVWKGDVGIVRIGVTPGSLRHRFLFDVLQASLHAVPHLHSQVSLVSVDRYAQQLRDGEIAAAVVYSGSVDADLSSISVASEPYQIAHSMTHPLAKIPVLTFEDIVGQGIVWYGKTVEPDLHLRLFEAFRERGAVPNIAIESPTADTAIRWAAMSACVALVPEYDAQWAPRDMMVRPISDFTFEVPFSFVWYQAIDNPVRSAIIDRVRKISPSADKGHPPASRRRHL